MCCLVAIVALLGPRLGIILWWLFDMARWQRTFDTFWFPLLGTLFFPWTLLAYVLTFSGGIVGIDWLLIVIAILADLGSYGGGFGNRRRFMG